MKTLLFIFLNLSFLLSLKCQIALYRPLLIEEFEGKEIYVPFDGILQEEFDEYREILEKYWTYSKLNFIERTEFEETVEDGEYMLGFMGDLYTQTYRRKDPVTGLYKTRDLATQIHYYFGLYKIKKEEKKKETLIEKETVFEIELFPDPSQYLESAEEEIKAAGIDFGGYVKNWSPGLLMNYLKVSSTLLDKKEEVSPYKSFKDSRLLSQLKNKILYVPDYVLDKYNPAVGKETTKHEVKDLFKGYEFTYEIISLEDLNQKIMAGEDFYYLLYIKGSTAKYVNVFNSKTGERAYGNYAPVSYNIKSKDLEKLTKAIKKN